MPDREKVISALHCRGQDLMIDLPACDKCDYQTQMINRMGCDFRQLCRDVLELLKEQPEIIRCKDCRHGEKCNSVYLCGKSRSFGIAHDPSWFCADGKRIE